MTEKITLISNARAYLSEMSRLRTRHKNHYSSPVSKQTEKKTSAALKFPKKERIVLSN